MRSRTYTDASLELAWSSLFIQQPVAWWRWTASWFCTSMLCCTAGGFSFDLVTLFCLHSTSEARTCCQFDSNLTEKLQLVSSKGNHHAAPAWPHCVHVVLHLVLMRECSTSQRTLIMAWIISLQSGRGRPMPTVCLHQIGYSWSVRCDSQIVRLLFLHSAPAAQIHKYVLCIIRRTPSAIWIATSVAGRGFGCIIVADYRNVHKIPLVLVAWQFYFFSNSRPLFFICYSHGSGRQSLSVKY